MNTVPMVIPELDTRTLLAVLCMTLALSSLVLALLYRLHRGLPGPREWVIGMVAISVGVGLLYGRNLIPSFWSIAVANALVLIGHAFLVAGIRRFFGQPVGWSLLATIVVVFCLPIVLFHDAPDAIGLRIISISLGMSLLALLGAWTLKRESRLQLNALQAVAVLLTLHGVINLARATQHLLQPVLATDIMQLGPSTSTFFVWGILFFFGMTAGLSVMVTERLRDMLRERLDKENAARCAAEATLQEQLNFLTMVSHEFRTPLGIMAASADLIACNLPADDQESAEELDRIHRASRRLSNLVEGCLADDWLESVSQSRRSGELNVTTVLAELASEYNVTLHADAEPIWVDADPYLLPIAFSALLDNACKYALTHEGVALSCRQKGNHVEVAVRDDGPGIDPADVSRLFQKFYRARRTQHKPGAGLGLHLVQRIVTLHNGSISLDQTHGTVFCVSLPMLKT
ncbi:sensor histidine kinase [Vreelandella salicampi]|uniref:histidine kinase n=1 Tax=Vreelandella salicampi TaxID=1449798 RepID=A0A7Z0LNW5_9GAMM|nr:HAMP domain-containing sensor histidine kinase [Halomonas salicampi]NYS62414.1 HAMP domain-containing histidine kinase [Halomonas salicampi]